MKKPTRHKITKSASFVLTYSRNDPACVPNQSVSLNHSNVNYNLIRNVSICSLRLKPSWSLNFMGSSSFLRSNNSIQFHTKNRRESKPAENSHVAPAGVSGRRLWVQKKTENMEKGNFPNDTPLSPCCPLLNPSCSFSHWKFSPQHLPIYVQTQSWGCIACSDDSGLIPRKLLGQKAAIFSAHLHFWPLLLSALFARVPKNVHRRH